MKALRLTAIVDILVQDNADEQEVATAFDNGAERQLQGFPKGDVVAVDVQSADVLSDEEFRELGYQED